MRHTLLAIVMGLVSGFCPRRAYVSAAQTKKVDKASYFSHGAVAFAALRAMNFQTDFRRDPTFLGWARELSSLRAARARSEFAVQFQSATLGRNACAPRHAMPLHQRRITRTNPFSNGTKSATI
jgi:hypothetical protein